MADFLTRTFDLGYSTGGADGSMAGERLEFDYRERACIATLSSLMSESVESQRLDKLATQTVGCSSWSNTPYKSATIPGTTYATNRLLVTEKVTGGDLDMVPFVLGAFDGGYKAGVDDVWPTRDRISAAILETCRIELKRHPEVQAAGPICARIQLAVESDSGAQEMRPQ